MSVVAVSENMGSLGIEIGHAVAARLGYEFAERDMVSKAADRFGADVARLSHAVEERPTLGSGKPVTPADIAPAVRLSRDVSLALVAGLIAVGLVRR